MNTAADSGNVKVTETVMSGELAALDCLRSSEV